MQRLHRALLRLQRLRLEARHDGFAVLLEIRERPAARRRARGERRVVLAQVLHRERVGRAVVLLQVRVPRLDALVQAQGKVRRELDARLVVAAELIRHVLELGAQRIRDAERKQLRQARHRVHDILLVHADAGEEVDVLLQTLERVL